MCSYINKIYLILECFIYDIASDIKSSGIKNNLYRTYIIINLDRKQFDIDIKLYWVWYGITGISYIHYILWYIWLGKILLSSLEQTEDLRIKFNSRTKVACITLFCTWHIMYLLLNLCVCLFYFQTAEYIFYLSRSLSAKQLYLWYISTQNANTMLFLFQIIIYM